MVGVGAEERVTIVESVCCESVMTDATVSVRSKPAVDERDRCLLPSLTVLPEHLISSDVCYRRIDVLKRERVVELHEV